MWVMVGRCKGQLGDLAMYTEFNPQRKMCTLPSSTLPCLPPLTTTWPDLWHGTIPCVSKEWPLLLRSEWGNLIIVGYTYSRLGPCSIHLGRPLGLASTASVKIAHLLRLSQTSPDPQWPLASLQDDCGTVHSQEGLSHSVICRHVPLGGEGDNSQQLLPALGPCGTFSFRDCSLLRNLGNSCSPPPAKLF